MNSTRARLSSAPKHGLLIMGIIFRFTADASASPAPIDSSPEPARDSIGVKAAPRPRESDLKTGTSEARAESQPSPNAPNGRRQMRGMEAGMHTSENEGEGLKRR